MPIDYTLPFALGILCALAAAAVLLGLGARRAFAWVFRRRVGPRRRLRNRALALLVLGVTLSLVTVRLKGSSLTLATVDLVLSQAPRPASDFRARVIPPAPYLLLAGDIHCHVHPPDGRNHVVRGLDETVRLARAEGLDFVSLLPHSYGGLHAPAANRAAFAAVLADLRAQADARAEQGVILDVGIEYVETIGHFGMVFGDVPAALAAVGGHDRVAPRALLDAFEATGGILVLFHPVLTPVQSMMPATSVDYSWQPFTGHPRLLLPEIAEVNERAEGLEVANLFVSAARDWILFHDREASTRRALRLLDDQILTRGRRMTPVGGTDSHGFNLRPMTFVLAEERSHQAIRSAVHAGRTCVVQPEACTFEVRAEGREPWKPVGSALSRVAWVDVRASGRAVAVYRNGELVATPASGEAVRVAVPAEPCSVLRAVVDGGYSAPVYVNCPFAAGDQLAAEGGAP